MWKHYLEKHETERLLIRPLVESDYLVWKEFIMDKLATKFFPDDWKLHPDKSIEWINSQLNRYHEKRYGLHALIDKKTGDFIGQCGLLAQEVNGKFELEIGYHLIPRYWGNGYAIEAATEFKKLCFDNNLATSIISIIDVENIQSQNVAIRNGMTKELKTKFLDLNVYIFRIKQEEYKKQ